MGDISVSHKIVERLECLYDLNDLKIWVEILGDPQLYMVGSCATEFFEISLNGFVCRQAPSLVKNS